MSKNTMDYYINQLPDGIREKAIANIKSKSIPSDLRKVLLGVGINTANKTVYSDSRKQGVSVKVCNTYLTDDLRQEVKEKMEQLGYRYHSINVPSPKYAGGYQGFSGTRFHFS